PAMRLFGQVGTRDIFVIAALLTVLGASWLMASFGLSMALGAFIAGVMLADSPYRHELESVIEPFRGLLMGLFFLAIGMTIDIFVIIEHPLRVLKLVLIVLVLKTLMISALVWMFGTPAKKAVQTGLLLSQGGEFAFVLLGAAVSGLLIAPAASSLFTAVVTLSMIASIILVKLYRFVLIRFLSRPVTADGMVGPSPGKPGSVIVVGYGRFGQIVTQMLYARGLNVVLVDSQPAQILRSRRFGWEVFYGDGFRPDVLRQAGADEARLLIVTTGGAWPSSRLAPVRHAFPNLDILVRAHDRQHYIELMAAGLDLNAVRELFHGAIELGRVALAEVGTPDETVEEVTREFMRRDSEQLALQVASGDAMAGIDSHPHSDPRWRAVDLETSLGEIPPAETIDDG
ncbi:MAG: cation:proton antiporter, partial [Paracoccaceae bacterium]